MFKIEMSDWQEINPVSNKQEIVQAISRELGVGYSYQFKVENPENTTRYISGISDLVSELLETGVVKIINKDFKPFTIKLTGSNYDLFR